MNIINPVLPGFNPDPSICRVADDYYIATSTFEWYPGVQIHHSKNLADWRLITRPLTRECQLDMRGNPDSCGIWAPCLSYADGLFWLVYTDVKRYDGNFKDAHNYLVVAEDIGGPWSDPVYLNSSGFDPSLFHDDDGRKWLLNLVWNHRASQVGQTPLNSPFGGIVLQEYNTERSALGGSPLLVFTGSERGLTEGPHVFKRAGYYYLVVAEGGTGYEHAVTHARSVNLAGPWELHPDVHVITADPADGATLQRAGHGQTVETPDGEWYHTHLCTRPLEVADPDLRRSPLGRETGLQRCVWGDDGWLRLTQGGAQPHVRVPLSGAIETVHSHPERSVAEQLDLAQEPVGDVAQRYEFADELPLDFQWLRTPHWQRLFSLSARPGCLRLYGRESIGSWFEQALVARRQQHLSFTASTRVDFDPVSFQQSAGLALYYNRHKFHYLQITHDETQGRVLSIMSCAGDWPECRLSFPMGDTRVVPEDGAVDLRCVVNRADLQFSWRQGEYWKDIGPLLDASVISDEGGRGEHASFTGAFVGMLAFDVSGRARAADFHSFRYAPR